MSYKTGHLDAFDPQVQSEAVAWVMRTLRSAPFSSDPLTRDDAIAFRGQSGAAVAYPIAALTGIPLAHVRKPECTSHLGERYHIVGNARPSRYVIVDDFIDSGATVNAIHGRLRECSPKAWCLGIILYKWMHRDPGHSYRDEFVSHDAEWNVVDRVPVYQRLRTSDGSRSEPDCNLTAEIEAWATFTSRSRSAAAYQRDPGEP